MRLIPILAFFFLSSSVHADQNQRLANIVDTFSRVPVSLSGSISIEAPIILGEENVDILGPISANAKVEWRKYKPISFRLTENEMSISTSEAFYLKVAGINFRINSISYNRNGHFQVEMDSPIKEKSLERRVAASFERRFKEKMDQALQKLSVIRSQKNGRDAKAVIEEVLSIFKTPPRPGLTLANVPMMGNVDLNFDFPRAQSLAVNDNFVLDIPEQDMLSAGGNFRRTNGKYKISEIEFRSSKGVTFRPIDGSHLSLKSLRVKSLTISDRGIEPIMVSGVEETATGVLQLIGLISNAAGVVSLGAGPDCDPRIEEIQAYLKKQFRGDLAPLVRQHRAALLEAGIDLSLLKALEG